MPSDSGMSGLTSAEVPSIGGAPPVRRARWDEDAMNLVSDADTDSSTASILRRFNVFTNARQLLNEPTPANSVTQVSFLDISGCWALQCAFCCNSAFRVLKSSSTYNFYYCSWGERIKLMYIYWIIIFEFDHDNLPSALVISNATTASNNRMIFIMGASPSVWSAGHAFMRNSQVCDYYHFPFFLKIVCSDYIMMLYLRAAPQQPHPALSLPNSCLSWIDVSTSTCPSPDRVVATSRNRPGHVTAQFWPVRTVLAFGCSRSIKGSVIWKPHQMACPSRHRCIRFTLDKW